MLTQQSALQILINAVQQANTKGAFTLQESKVIAEAVAIFTTPATPVKEEEKVTETTTDAK